MRASRSLHFVPGGNERMVAKALATNADVLILDLEDAVAPARKAAAREAVAAWLRDADFGRKQAAVRINPLDSPWGMADLDAMMATPPAMFLVPKPSSAQALATLDAALSRLEREGGHPTGSVGLMPIVETPAGVLNAPGLAGCPRLTALTWGAEDLAASLGAASNLDAEGNYLPVYEHCRIQTLLAASAAGVPAIDAVTVDFRDQRLLERHCARAARDGFAGKLSIHPDQIDVINAAFTPAAAEIAAAEELVAAFDAAQAEGRMAFEFDSQMVDAPHLAQARALLARAEQLGSRGQE